MELVLLCIPWLLVAAYLILAVRVPKRLLPPSPWVGEKAQSVSIIVPARNEEDNIRLLLDSLAQARYPEFEVIVVDDQSQDETQRRVREADAGNALRVLAVEGESPPPGWFGKPWACHQGAGRAQGDLLLFTDADTIHHPDLLQQAVQTLLEEKADALTVVGEQVMGSFWERLLQPQFFALLAFRFPRAGTPRRPHRWRHAIANGQYLLFRREVYDGVGGHEAVRGEVVEDMRMAQLLVRSGKKLVVREGRGLRTRMYRSLRGLVEGWSKNIATGALQAVAPWLLSIILPLSFLTGFILWLLPPLVLGWALLTGAGGLALAFGASTVLFGVLFWGLAAGFMGASPLYGLAYPLGSVVSAYIFVRSWVRGGRIRWKGREYEMARGTRLGREDGHGS